MKKVFSLVLFTFFLWAGVGAQPRIIAHRGGRAEFDENTLEAFKASLDAGCRGFETDIHFTADRELVIMHDNRLDRTTDGKGYIEKTQSSYIKGIKTKEGHKVPFLEDLTALFKDYDGLYVEWEMKTTLKDYTDEMVRDYCEAVYAVVMKDKPAGSTYVFSSFDTRPLMYMHLNHPDAEIMLITGKACSRETVDLCLALGLHRLAATLNGASRETVKYAHDKGVILNLWPGTSVSDTHLAALLGADILCTDIPVEVMGYIRDNSLNIKF